MASGIAVFSIQSDLHSGLSERLLSALSSFEGDIPLPGLKLTEI